MRNSTCREAHLPQRSSLLARAQLFPRLLDRMCSRMSLTVTLESWDLCIFCCCRRCCCWTCGCVCVIAPVSNGRDAPPSCSSAAPTQNDPSLRARSQQSHCSAREHCESCFRALTFASRFK
ncbi:unnamed protein product [Periconia digitata]|uniref:Uncharacterized protein n=1 Tax=Periconia digitata TaxID=1303443 RepID=A0A9W4XL40_9PLEO|nr:unnamed protein product [Periconia digitata]